MFCCKHLNQYFHFSFWQVHLSVKGGKKSMHTSIIKQVKGDKSVTNPFRSGKILHSHELEIIKARYLEMLKIVSL